MHGLAINRYAHNYTRLTCVLGIVDERNGWLLQVLLSLGSPSLGVVLPLADLRRSLRAGPLLLQLAAARVLEWHLQLGFLLQTVRQREQSDLHLLRFLLHFQRDLLDRVAGRYSTDGLGSLFPRVHRSPLPVHLLRAQVLQQVCDEHHCCQPVSGR